MAGTHAMTVVGELVGKVDPAAWDPIGRWIGQDFRRDAVPLYLVSATTQATGNQGTSPCRTAQYCSQRSKRSLGEREKPTSIDLILLKSFIGHPRQARARMVEKAENLSSPSILGVVCTCSYGACVKMWPSLIVGSSRCKGMKEVSQ